MHPRTLVSLLLVVGCGANDGNPLDVVGPFTGETRRFVVDAVEFPTNNTSARALGRDLNGDRTVDNQLGMVLGTLASYDDINEHAADIFAAGTIISSIEVQADDFSNDPTVSVRYVAVDGDPSVAVGGALVDGKFTSNRTATTSVPGAARIRLPVFASADPSNFDLVEMQLELVPDGAGGFDAFIQGGTARAVESAFPGIAQMLANAPRSHYQMFGVLDIDLDWRVSFSEFSTNNLIASLLAPDFGENLLSFGFRVHASPCATGSCASGATSCFDRARNGDESDVDCGGSCGPCTAEGSCNSAGDCETGGCDAGTCRAATCSDGLRDGVETDIDCGAACGATCQLGQRCYYARDCANKRCGGDKHVEGLESVCR